MISQTCINVGGRLIRYNDEKRVIYVSERFRKLGVLRNILIQEGELLTEKDLKAAGELLADTILDSIHMDHYSLTEIATNNMSEMLQLELPVEYLSFSGGVADCYYNQENNLTRYYDLGVALAQALAEKVENESFRVIRPQETIRATVVGAGSYMTEVSGSTISYNENVFPMKNLPVFVMGKESEYEMYQGFNQNAQRELKWYLEQIQDQRVAICMKGKEKLSYVELCNLAESLLMLDEQLFSGQFPLILVCANDMAKALGQVLNQKMKRRKSIVCLDCIRVRSGDYIDIGKPVMDGMAIPIVVKTLIFS